MSTLSIARFHNRLRMPAHVWRERSRIARIFDTAVHELLERALIESGVDPHDDVCIRRVAAFTRLRLTHTDTAVAQAWSRALAQAIRDASRTETSDIVRYRSRGQAVADMVARVARRDLSRTWAWEQLGLWRIGSHTSEAAGAREVMRVLVANPELALPSLISAGLTGVRTLMAHTSGDVWTDLCDAIVHIVAPGTSWERTAAAAQFSTMTDAADLEHPAGHDHAEYVLTRSVIARGALAQWGRMAADARLARAVATLSVAEVEPTLLQHEPAATFVPDAVARRLAGLEDGATHERRDQPNTPQASAPPHRSEPSEEHGLAEPAQTEYGGLLYLLNVLDAIDLPPALHAVPELAHRPSRWVFHQLAIVLTGCDAANPAALAFAGLRPGTTPPDQDGSPITERESHAIASLAGDVVDHLVHLFADADEPRAPLELVSWLCDRRAEVVADAGWIEIRFPLDAVDTSVRRLGLDLNPDFVRWLGVVVRFAYV